MSIVWRTCATCKNFVHAPKLDEPGCKKMVGFITRFGDLPAVHSWPEPADCCDEHQTEDEAKALEGESCR